MIWRVQIFRNIAWTDVTQHEEEGVASTTKNSKEGHLLVVEPTPTFTHGRFAKPEGRRWSDAEVAHQGVEVHAVKRGGQWPYHGPGQIVVFPIVQLSELGWSQKAVHQFLSRLRQSVQDCVSQFGIATEAGECPFGVFANGKKLVSFGLAFRRGISMHGLALYHSPQDRYFQGIYPCGQSSENVTSLQELSPTIPGWETVASSLVQAIKKGFKK